MLSARALTCRLGGKAVVRDVSLDVLEGTFVALSGPSGCGKSTLLRLLCGLLECESGTITLDGKALPARRDRASRRGWHRQVLLLPQDTSRAFNPARGLRDQFRDAMKLHGLGEDTAARDEAADVAMGQVGLSPALLDRFAAQLSGGQRQRAALARLTCLRPRVLLLDEPSSALDPISAAEFLDLVAELRRGRHCAVLMTTHDRGLAATATSMLSMENGRLLG